MNCNHVLAVIDAGPFADTPVTVLDAARAHARDCLTCGAAFETASALDAGLASVGTSTVAPDLTARVLVRISSIELETTVTEAVEPDSVAARIAAVLPIGATILSGVTAAAIAVATRPAPRASWLSWLVQDPLVFSERSPVALVALVGTLTLYILSLSAPLASGKRGRGSRPL